MKTHQIILTVLAAAGLFSVNQAQAQSFPVVPLSVNGTFYYNTNQTLDDGLTSLKTLSTNFNSKDLVSLLAKSPAVAGVVADVTGASGIPAGTHLVVVANFSKFDVIATNKNGFSFPLQGNDPVTGHDYSFAGIVGTVPIVSSFTAASSATTGRRHNRPSREHDRLPVSFFFDDGEGDSFSITSVAQIEWAAFKPGTDGTQRVDVSFEVSGSGAAVYNGVLSTVEVDGSGTGSGNESTADSNQFPFWLWFWLMQLPPVNT